MIQVEKLTSILLGILAAFCVAVLLKVGSSASAYLWGYSTFSFFIIAPLILLSIIIYSFTLGAAARLNLTIALVACAVSLYMAELALILAGPYITLPSSFDRRNKLEVVHDLRERGTAAVPSVHPKNIMPDTLQVSGHDFLPLAGVPRTTTVFCNEVGTYYIYESDEYGFTNPKGLYSSNIEIGLIGDSFTQGFCAPGGASYADRLRAAWPRTLNLGNNGNGPLLELATLREFLTPLKPRYVFWFYFEGNDLEDLTRELAHPLLQKYLEDPNYSQHLFDRVPQYTVALKNFVEESIEAESRVTWQEAAATLPEKFKLFVKLWHIRALAGLTDVKRDWPLRHWSEGITEERAERTFDYILREARARTEGWGGELIFVYLPSYRTYGYRISHPWRDRVLELVTKNGIDLIDFHLIFTAHRDPISLFNFRKEAHYTDVGNAMIAEVLRNYLSQKKARQLSVWNQPPGR